MAGDPVDDAAGMKWWRAASWVLRAGVLIHALGFFVAMHTRVGSSLGGIALMDWGVAHGDIAFHERLWSKVLLALAVSLLIRPFAIVAMAVGGVFLVEAWAAWSFGGDPFYQWALFSQSLRYLAPLALGVLLFRRRPWNGLLAMGILRVGLAIVFIAHGLMAFYQHPGFIDLLIGSTRNLTGWRLTESAAVRLLQVIGVVDVIVAVMVLVGRWRGLLLWLCLWSLITALSRMTSYGLMSYPELLSRASHVLAPVAVYGLGRWEDAALPEGWIAWMGGRFRRGGVGSGEAIGVG